MNYDVHHIPVILLAKGFGFCSISCFLFPDCSVSNLQTLLLPWIMWERHKISDGISVQTCFVNVVLLWVTFYSPWDKSFEASLQSYWIHRVWKLYGALGQSHRKKEFIWKCSGLCVLLRNLVCSINILGIISFLLGVLWLIYFINTFMCFFFKQVYIIYTHTH